MSQLRVGDKVHLEFEVTYAKGNLFRYKTGTGESMMLLQQDIKKVIRGPIIVGDQILFVARFPEYAKASHWYTLLYILEIDSVKFALVGYADNMPKIVWFEDLRPCVD